MGPSMRNRTRSTTRRRFLFLAGAAAVTRLERVFGADQDVTAPQPYFAEVNRALETLAKLGAPIAEADAEHIVALRHQGDRAAVDSAEAILDRYTLAQVRIDGGRTLQISTGAAQRSLVEQGWRLFLIRVLNPTARSATLELTTSGRSGLSQFDAALLPGHMSFEPIPVNSIAQRPYIFDTLNRGPIIEAQWLLSKIEDPATGRGCPIEYHVVQIFSRDRGRRTGVFAFVVSPTAESVSSTFGHRDLDFDCVPSSDVELRISDFDGRGCLASVTIRDDLNRIYPPQVMRLAPDMAFQPQVYRADGETVRLPDGDYTVESKRGPEYLRSIQRVSVGASNKRIDLKLERWIDPAKWGWYSGDTHIHAAGCAHYESPTEGVSPETMIRQVRGEGLAIGDILSWGPGWYYQKQFFKGHAESPPATLEHPELQKSNHATWTPRETPEDSDSALRYDVEVSGFPSSHAGHLVLLRLQEQDYPGTKMIEDWPSWNLPILRWTREQGAVGGYAHCGLGMVVDSAELPNYEIPPMDGLGTQEAIIDVTHGLVDFLSGCDTNPVAELNAWYHMLNCGFRMAMVGETDYPCLTDERPGQGRSYVRLDARPTGDAGYEAWIRGLTAGRLYCGDGRSHFLEFTVNGHRSGGSDLLLNRRETVLVEALVAARLEPAPEIPPKPSHDQLILGQGGWAWHLELARIGGTRAVPVELVVNGQSVDKTTLLADGVPRRIRFKASVARSSWIALRILPSAHTHPVFVLVGEKPIRASQRSAQWCRACVDKIWEVKSPFMRESERPAAADAFDHARGVYEAIIRECKGT
jgi:hypothetical protein